MAKENWSERIYKAYIEEYKTKSLADLIHCLICEVGGDVDRDFGRIKAIKECINKSKSPNK